MFTKCLFYQTTHISNRDSSRPIIAYLGLDFEVGGGGVFLTNHQKFILFQILHMYQNEEL